MSEREEDAETKAESVGPAKIDPALSRKDSVSWIAGAFLVTALLVGAFAYRLIFRLGFGHTSLMFIGIPLVLAVLLALAPRPASATGSILRGITLALLLVAPLVGEGYLCILFTSPLFLGVGLIVGWIVDMRRKSRGVTLSCIALLVPLSLEGVAPQLTHGRTQAVAVTQVVDAPANEVQAALARSPEVGAPLPRFLRIGFPRPLEAHGAGLAINDVRVIHFSGAEGDPPGDLTMQVAQSDPGYVRFETVSDTSKLTQWLRWRSSEVTWQAVDAAHTRVTWRITFDRELDPFWYFTPWEHVAVREASKYLIAANATPQRARNAAH